MLASSAETHSPGPVIATVASPTLSETLRICGGFAGDCAEMRPTLERMTRPKINDRLRDMQRSIPRAALAAITRLRAVSLPSSAPERVDDVESVQPFLAAVHVRRGRDGTEVFRRESLRERRVLEAHREVLPPLLAVGLLEVPRPPDHERLEREPLHEAGVRVTATELRPPGAEADIE